jgi:DNA-binding NarL/FixJ family response regulator
MSETNPPIRVALADDQELFIESLSALLSRTEGVIEVIWSARSGEEAIAKVAEALPDVLVLDYFFRGKTLDGGETCRQIVSTYPNLGVLLLSVSCELQTIREALQKGAKGYASKEISKAELIRGIEAVARGEYFLDQTALKVMIDAQMPRSHQQMLLTRRESEVALPYAKGLRIADMAKMLFVSEDTIETHIKNIRSKLGATNRYEVAEYLKKHGAWEEDNDK